MNTHYTVERNVQILISLLKHNGIRKIIASPGTTNITFVASLQSDPFFEMYSAADERSAAYMACGLAEESGEPVVITCTGATASRNYLPGLTEAYYRKLPVLAVTSMAGRSKIGNLNPQIIDRSRIQNDVAVFSAQVPFIHDSEEERLCVLTVNKALIALKADGGGPVHLDVETRISTDFSVTELPSVRSIGYFDAEDALPDIPDGNVCVFVGSHLPWTEDETKALDEFCGRYDAVAFCDLTSNYAGRFAAKAAAVFSQKYIHTSLLRPDLLIHIGEISGDYYTWSSLKPKSVWRVSKDGELKDAFKCLDNVFHMSERFFFRHYSDLREPFPSVSGKMAGIENEYNSVVSSVPELPFSNLWVARSLADRIPAGAVLHLGILNSLRSWNFFRPDPSIKVFSNVGGFGIDGGMSSLLGSSLASPEILHFGVFGDLAFFYDMNSLGNRHVGKNIRILLINNGKGTEFRNFSHPASMWGDEADAFIAAGGHYGNKSHDLVSHYARDLGFEYLSASCKDEFAKVSDRFLEPGLSRPVVMEVFTGSKDESDALEMFCDALRPDSKDKAKDLIKSVFGKDAIERVNKLMGRK